MPKSWEELDIEGYNSKWAANDGHYRMCLKWAAKDNQIPPREVNDMRLTAESTDQIVEIEKEGIKIPARVWEAKTETGTPCLLYVTRIQVDRESTVFDPIFDEQLRECKPPTNETVKALKALDMRLLID